MYSENGVLVDFEEINRLMDTADVFAVGFATFPERLIVDTRSNAEETPMVQVVEPARSARERITWLNRRRPSLGSPEAFNFFAWPHSPAFMLQSGVWERLCRRVAADRDVEVGIQCDLAIKQLQNLDREAALALLHGEHCLTLWPRQDDPEDDQL